MYYEIVKLLFVYKDLGHLVNTNVKRVVSEVAAMKDAEEDNFACKILMVVRVLLVLVDSTA